MRKLMLDGDIADRILGATSIEEAWEAIRKLARRTGFDGALYGANRLRQAGMFGSKEDSLFLTDMPEQFMSRFWTQDHYLTTPAAVWAMQNTGVRPLKDFGDLYRQGKLPPDHARSQEALTQAGVSSGYVVAFNTPESTFVSALAFINLGKDHAAAAADWEEHGAAIQLFARMFQLRANALPVPLRGRQLTGRQREVLRWVGAGKSMADIATILGISVATVEKHLRQIREALGVSTTAQAVLHAELRDQIFSGKG